MTRDQVLTQPLPDAEKGKAIWRGRRRNEYAKVVGQIRMCRGPSAAEVVPAISILCDFLARFLASGPLPLPRGYTWTRNALSEPAIAKDGCILAASCVDPWPSGEVVLQFCSDVRSGWLDELAVSLGMAGAYSLVEGIEC